MYLNLPATATRDRIARRAHRSLAENIEQLSLRRRARFCAQEHCQICRLNRPRDSVWLPR
jgi:hypothetical protein